MLSALGTAAMSEQSLSSTPQCRLAESVSGHTARQWPVSREVQREGKIGLVPVVDSSAATGFRQIAAVADAGVHVVVRAGVGDSTECAVWMRALAGKHVAGGLVDVSRMGKSVTFCDFRLSLPRPQVFELRITRMP